MAIASNTTQIKKLGSDELEIQVAPDFGARVISLVDCRSGRNWLTQGPMVGAQDNDADFTGDPSRGWDECFPTVSRCLDPTWGRNLRDHGDLWARRWSHTSAQGQIACTYSAPDYTFTRSLTLDGARLQVDYKLSATSRTPLPWIWSQHCLLACQPGERFEIEGLGDIRTDSGELADLTPIRGMEDGFAQKSYGKVRGQARIGVVGPQGSIHFTWAEEDAPYLGLWLSYGGWPTDNPTHQIAIEPTTAPVGQLDQAIAQNTHKVLQPDSSVEWQIQLDVSA
ncbi:hypothetical protein PSQ19_07965 [Devosia algicola]|uniref:DUF4432 family protein n=1 Tax=Devosia algicola TaxID=3026418 RepID=A0ABY7YRJ3_9HYPH|nr:hypothetical protein [Devosia algicola]WDR03948.1 hypothetical protein PSQ19_07965 [Devosia algicola]